MTARITGSMLVGLALAACGSVADAAPEQPEGIEMSVFRVPSRHGLAPASYDRALNADGADASGAEPAGFPLMPADVVALPGEDLDEALERALADGRGSTSEAPTRAGAP